MKINVDIECTPEEARTLLGLPDVKPLQKALMDDIEARMKKTLTAMEPDSLFKMWLPASLEGVEQWQRFIWSSVQRAMSNSRSSEDDDGPRGK